MRSIKTLAMALMASALFVACSDEQSTFNIEEIPGRCAISGQIVYNQGTTYEDGKFVYNYKPLANAEVFVTVSNSDYDDDFSGNSVFTTTTDEQGNYSIEIPATSKNISATVTTADFLTERTVVEIVNNKVETKTETVVMRGYHSFSDIHSNGIRLASFVCTECNRDQDFNGYNEYASLTGTVGQNVEYKEAATARYDEDDHLLGYNDARIVRCFEPAGRADMVVTIKYSDGNTFSYNTTTDNAGQFAIQVPVMGFPASFDYTVSLIPYDGKFTHYEAVEKEGENYYESTYRYTDYEAHTLTGYYAQQYCTSTYSAYYPVAAQVVDNDFKAMLFNPLNNGQDTYGYNKSSFSEYDMWLDDYKESIDK